MPLLHPKPWLLVLPVLPAALSLRAWVCCWRWIWSQLVALFLIGTQCDQRVLPRSPCSGGSVWRKFYLKCQRHLLSGGLGSLQADGNRLDSSPHCWVCSSVGLSRNTWWALWCSTSACVPWGQITASLLVFFTEHWLTCHKGRLQGRSLAWNSCQTRKRHTNTNKARAECF